ncbi:hypothetical protein BDZ97DRAFT_1919625 [Flammula alnicola]|nr:hypothetical protein BDZ97DRAFT_1919625 [Flammula alnicola]
MHTTHHTPQHGLQLGVHKSTLSTLSTHHRGSGHLPRVHIRVHIRWWIAPDRTAPQRPSNPASTFPSTSGSSGSSGSGSSGSSGPGSSSSTSSSNNSSRTVSTASSESLGGNAPPPMSPEDAKIIFSNVSELAMFADMFTEELELALGSVVEGDTRIGKTVQALHNPAPDGLAAPTEPAADAALQAYLSYTQTVASSVSHAWDLASLLIKPVQRLLKYPLLLAAIIDETPDAHPDKENLRNARVRVEEIARNVNEGRRRAEVVKDVLTSKTPKKPSAPVGVAASVNLSKVKSLRHGGVTAATMRVSQLAEGGNSEAARVEAMQAELKRLEVFAQQFAKNVVDWGKMMSNVMLALRTWALSFGKVIGLSAEQGSEAFDAFLGVVTTGLLPLTADLDAAINERLLRDMAHLLMTMNQPLKLLASMNEQEPYHYHLLTMPVSQKNRPPASLLAASTNYLALRGQLAAELPTYLALMHRGFAVFVRRLAGIQTRFWRDVKERWAELWEMLRVEGELNAGWEETCAVWCARWSDVDEVVKALGIMQPIPHLQPVVAQAQAQAQMQAQLGKGYATLQQQQQQQLEKEKNYAQFEQYFGYPEFYVPMTPNLSLPKDRERQLEKEREREREREQKEREKEQKQRDREQKDREKLERHHSSKSSSGSKGINIAAVNSMFAALEPAHSPVHKKQSAVNVTNMLASLYPSHPLDGSMYAGSTTNVANANGSMYSVSGPMPLGSVASFNHGKDGREAKRGRGRGASDASTMASGWSGASKSGGSAASGSSTSRRPSSQDSARSRPRPDTKSPNVNANSRRRTQGYGLADEFDEYMAVNGTTIPPSYEGGQYPYSPGGGGSRAKHLTRMKSMPLSHQTSLDKASMLTTTTNRTVGQGPSLGNGGGYAVEGDRVYYQPPLEESWEEYQQHQESPSQPQQREKERGRDRSLPANSRSQTMPVLPMATTTTSPKTKSKERPSHARKRSGSTKSITAFFTGSDRNSNPAPPPDPQPLTASQRDSWVSKPAKYVCQVIHPCRPPASVQYYSFPFFTLQEGDLYQVLQEAGHPSIHPKLPLYVDDGEDCLLLCRDGNGVVGWALASFLEPVTMET